ncbi:MAG: response regulator transcription factor [Bacteroidota bacterium]
MDRSNIRISLIEDNDKLRDGLEMIIDTIDKFNVVSTYSTCEEALKNLHRDIPDIILIDINLPGMNGIKGISKIKKILPRVEIIVNTIYEESEYVFDALKAGANGYITKGSDRMNLLRAIDEVLDGGAPMSAKIANMVVSSFQRNPKTPLTPRETEVLSLLAQGKTYQYISDQLFVSLETVKSHIKNIYSKLHVTSKNEALEKAARDRLI